MDASMARGRRGAVKNDARRFATHRVIFVGHAAAWSAVTFFLLFVAGFTVATIVGLAWGLLVAAHAFVVLAAPELWRRFAEEGARRELDGTPASSAAPVGAAARGRDPAGKSLEELAASIAHEIRNPITAAKSLVQQIGDDPNAKENAEYARVALEELERVERAVSHLLRYARDEELTLAPVALEEVVSAALDTMADRIEKSPARIERDADPGAAIRGDADKLRRVVMNLVGNALDAVESNPQSPVVRVSSGRSLAGTDAWLRVKDNGKGIEKSDLPKIFSPFYTSKANGTGLGLAIVKKLIEAHGGAIEVSSTPGAGTEVVVTFPRSEA
jgi:signal transduction histidine kinase